MINKKVRYRFLDDQIEVTIIDKIIDTSDSGSSCTYYIGMDPSDKLHQFLPKEIISIII